MAKKKSDLPKNIYRLSSGHYSVQISINRKTKSFGTYEKLDDAIAARNKVYEENGLDITKKHRGASNEIDLTGQKFGELTVLKKTKKRAHFREIVWKCQCSCGKIVEVVGSSLRSGHAKSCGHVATKKLIEASKKAHQIDPGSNPYMLTNKKPSNNTSGEKNISITYQNGVKKYRVAVVYKKKQYGSTCNSMAEAIELREELRRKYWPNYEK